MSGTDIGRAPTCYASPTPCPVLTNAMLLPALAALAVWTTMPRSRPLPAYEPATPCPVLTYTIVLPAAAVSTTGGTLGGGQMVVGEGAYCRCQ
eukprot:299229-Rhodomonas_salina.5